MEQTGLASIDDYIASQPVGSQETLRTVRAAIREALPEASEGISYKMPGYWVGKHSALQFAGWKDHWSLYLATPSLMAEFGIELAPYKIDKGTIHFPWSKPVPVDLIQRIARFRVSQLSAREETQGLSKPRAPFPSATTAF